MIRFISMRLNGTYPKGYVPLFIGYDIFHQKSVKMHNKRRDIMCII